MKQLLAIAVVGTYVLLPTFAHAYTCDQVRWAVSHFTKEQIAEYAGQASATERAAAQKCLATKSPKAAVRVAKQGRPVKAVAGKTVKTKPAHKSLARKVIPLPRPKPAELVEKRAPSIISPAAAETAATEVAPEPRRSPVSEYLLYVSALAGAVWATWFIMSKGIVPAYQAVRGWATSGAAEIEVLKVEVDKLRAQVETHATTLRAIAGPQHAPPPSGPGPIPTTQTA